MQRAAVVGLIAVVIGVTVWLLQDPGRAPAQPRATQERDEPDAPPTSERAAAAQASRAAPTGDTPPPRQAAPETPTPGGAATVTLRGRCVDERGAPLAGCDVALHGWGADRDRLDAYRNAHGEIDWTDPKAQTTGADGRFAFTFVPPPPYQFSLRISARDRIEMRGRWGELEPADTKDLGDVVMTGGCTVGGQIVDSDGVPQAGVDVFVSRLERRPLNGIGPRGFQQAESGADGRFEIAALLSPGTWELRVRGRQKISPQELEVPAGRPTHSIEVRVRAQRDIESIAGIVVDDAGEPLAGVRVRHSTSPGGQGWTNSSARDGTFTIDKKDGERDGDVRITLQRRGYADLVSKEAFPWGSTGLRLVMQRCPTVEVRVVDAETKAPIEDYAIRAFSLTSNTISSDDYRVRARGTHPEGRTVLEGIAPGKNMLFVEPRGDTWVRHALAECEVTEGAPTVHVVEVARRVSRPVILHRGDGEAIAGSTIELLTPTAGAAIDVSTYTVETEMLMNLRGSAGALLADRGTTDEQGAVALAGGGATDYFVRALGPGHTPLVHGPIRLDPDEPLVLTASTGAAVTGRITPTKLVEQLRSDGPARLSQGSRELTVSLQRGTGHGAERYPARVRDAAPIDDSGAFRIDGIPPGTWNLIARCYNSYTPIGVATALRDGETRKLDLALDHLVRGTLRGIVTVNGEPLADSRVFASAEVGPGLDGSPRKFSQSGQTDAEGRFELSLQEGHYRVFATIGDPRARTSDSIAAPTTVFVPRDQQVEAAFALTTCTLRLKLVGEDDTPLAEVNAIVRDPDSEISARVPTTDTDGRTKCIVAPGRYEVAIAPKALLSVEARRAFFEANRGDATAWQRAMIVIATVSVTAGDDTLHTLRVPARAGY